MSRSPSQTWGRLFHEVQTRRLFGDGKVFVDAMPKRPPAAILDDFVALEADGDEALRKFVLDNFTLPGSLTRAPCGEADAATLDECIAATWSRLERPPFFPEALSSALPLKHPYIVPGGRFGEMYYWDSYFTMLGLLRGRRGLIEAMIDNFTDLIERYGYIPNGTRSYYLTRSQPPVFFLMLALSDCGDRAVRERRLAALRQEHAFWMAGSEDLEPGTATGRVVRLPDGALLNRYWDAKAVPRDESYAEDLETAAAGPRPPEAVYRDLRAAAESGWDFSSRWWIGGRALHFTQTTAIAPVDLNCLMFGLESAIARFAASLDDAAIETAFAELAGRRAAAIREHFWHAAERRFADLHWPDLAHTPSVNAAMLFPLYVGLATAEQAQATAECVESRLLAPGGLLTTTERTSEQWDGPNGWAPLQWIAVTALHRYGHHALATSIATRWVQTVTASYDSSRRVFEKYDLERLRPGSGGEYVVQDGFGWTNGVTLALMRLYSPRRIIRDPTHVLQEMSSAKEAY